MPLPAECARERPRGARYLGVLPERLATVEKLGMSFPDTEFRGAKCVAVGFTPICSAADLRERHQSTSVIGLVFGDTCRRQED